MPTLDERLSRDLKRLSEPVDGAGLLERVARRKARRRVLRRVQGASLAAAVVAGSVLGTYGLLRAFRGEPQPAEPPRPAVSSWEQLPPGWTRLPAPSEVRSSAAMGWTGEHLVVWGGWVYTGFSDEQPEGDGFSFDARTRKWTPIPPSPLAPRVLPASAWTGREMVVWGGWDGSSLDPQASFFGDGAAYDPASDSWRLLPSAPISPRAPLSVWTGRELIVWGTSVRVDDPPRDGAAYDPAANSWRSIADAPVELTDATAVWTGHEMIVLGAALQGGNVPESKTAIGAAYDPATDTWRRLPDPTLSPQASTAAWNGRELIAWDYLLDAASYDPHDPGPDAWRGLPRVPLEDMECSPQSVAVDDYVIGEYCGAMVLFHPVEKWRDISRPDLAGWGVELVAADPVVLLLARDAETDTERFLAYRPSERSARTGSSPAPAEGGHAKERASPRDRALIRSLIRFARSPGPETWDDVPFAPDGVWLGLGPRLVERRSPEELADPEAWTLRPGIFRAGAGPFSALDLLADAGKPKVSAGPHPHCASPPMRPPARVAELRRVSVQPAAWESCLQWWTVDAFVTRRGEIRAITLDFFEP